MDKTMRAAFMLILIYAVLILVGLAVSESSPHVFNDVVVVTGG